MKRLYILIIAVSLTILANGQTQDQKVSGPMTLEQCIEYALQNAISAQNAIVDQRIAAAKVKETIGIGLPQVSGLASVQNNYNLRRFFTAYNPNGGFINLGDNPGIATGTVIAAPNFFQLKNSADIGITINQLLFNGSYLVGLKASSTYKELSAKAANQTREQIVMQVTKAYYAVLINKERASLFTSNIARVDTLLRNTKALNTNGLAEEIDVDRIQVTYNNLLAERDKFLNLNDLGMELLKFQMNYPMDQPIDVAGNIEDVKVEATITTYKEGFDYSQRPDFQVLQVNRRAQELVIKNQYAGALPVLGAVANLGYFTQSPDIAGLFSTNSDFSNASDAVKANFGTDKYYGYSLFGVNLSMNIFTGFQRHYRIQQEKLNLAKIDNNFRGLKNVIDLEVKQASVNFDNAIKSLTAQTANMELAGKVARVTKIKYQQGVGSNLEVVDAENSLRTAQTNYYSALFDAMVAKTDLEKAFGRLVPSSSSQSK